MTPFRLLFISFALLILVGFKVSRFGPEAVSFTSEKSPQAEDERIAAAWERFHHNQFDAKMSYTSSTMRITVKTLEIYAIDNDGRYPAHTSVHKSSALREPAGRTGVPGLLRLTSPGGPATLTTPITYIYSYAEDPYAARDGDCFGYYTTTTLQGKHGYVIFSPGPDAEFSLPWELYDPSKKDPQAPLRPYYFDPTNGLISDGDIVWTRRDDHKQQVKDWIDKGQSIFWCGPK